MSRRCFAIILLGLAGLALARRERPAPGAGDGIVVINGWVLRRDDL